MIDQLKRLEEIREALVLDYPEFAPLVLPLDLALEEIPGARMATDGRKMWGSPSFLEREDDANVATSVVHESIHNALGHVIRERMEQTLGHMPMEDSTSSVVEEYKHRLMVYRLAEDYVVNPIIKAAGFDLRDRVYEQKYEGWTVEEVYWDLMQQNEGKGPKLPVDGECEIVYVSGKGKEAETYTAQLKQAWADFLTLARQRGTLPGEFLDKLSQFLRPEIPWLELLMDKVTVVCGQEDYTWRRPSRRGLAIEEYLPSNLAYSIKCLAFCSDTSGSMSTEDCSKAVGGVITAAETVKIKKFVWIEGDAAVQRVMEYEGEFDPPFDVKGRRGTDLRPLIEEALKHEPVCIVYFTDLAGVFPDREPDVPVIWVTTDPRAKPPWGELVRIK